LRLVEIKRNKWAVYTDQNKVVIITTDLRIARGFLHGSNNSNDDRSTEDTA
jgi:uncharacterized protein with PhoU and TrkA domain